MLSVIIHYGAYDHEIEFLELFGSFLVLYHQLVPISLFILSDIIKVIFYISTSIKGHFGVKLKHCNYTYKIGEIEYVLLSKLGVISEGVHEVVAVAINGNIYLN